MQYYPTDIPQRGVIYSQTYGNNHDATEIREYACSR